MDFARDGWEQVLEIAGIAHGGPHDWCDMAREDRRDRREAWSSCVREPHHGDALLVQRVKVVHRSGGSRSWLLDPDPLTNWMFLAKAVWL
jgi:hypothetical protein